MLKEQFADITQRARHVSKLLDDNRKSYEEVLSELHDVYEHNHRTLTGNAPRFLRWLETDLGVYAMGDSVVGSSIPMAYRLGLDPSRSTIISGENVRAVSEEWGSTMAVASRYEPEFSIELKLLLLMIEGQVPRRQPVTVAHAPVRNHGGSASRAGSGL